MLSQLQTWPRGTNRHVTPWASLFETVLASGGISPGFNRMPYSAYCSQLLRRRRAANRPTLPHRFDVVACACVDVDRIVAGADRLAPNDAPGQERMTLGLFQQETD